MKRRSTLTLCGGLLLGAILGYGIAVGMQYNPSQQSNPATKPDRVVAHIDFPTLLAAAGEQKWSVQPLADGIDEMEWNPISPRQGNASTRSRRYFAKCDVPLDVNEESQFFYKFINLLHDKIGTHAVLKGGGAEGPGHQNGFRICSSTQGFITEGDHAHLQTRGGLRGTATVWLISDGKSAIRTNLSQRMRRL